MGRGRITGRVSLAVSVGGGCRIAVQQEHTVVRIDVGRASGLLHLGHESLGFVLFRLRFGVGGWCLRRFGGGGGRFRFVR